MGTNAIQYSFFCAYRNVTKVLSTLKLKQHPLLDMFKSNDPPPPLGTEVLLLFVALGA